MDEPKKRSKQTKGACALCGASYAKAGMTRHLAACLPKHLEPPAPSTSKRKKPAKLLHMVVQGTHAHDYWLEITVRSDTRLGDIDGFLRDIWVECCGHLSAFYTSDPGYGALAEDGIPADLRKLMQQMGAEESDLTSLFGRFGRRGPTEMDMGDVVGKVLRQGMKLRYEYDFGSTTELDLNVLGEYEGAQPDAVRVLARNEPPDTNCVLCGAPATQICSECEWENGGLYCDACFSKHAEQSKMEDHEDYSLPVVNSPRMGVCGYTG